MNTKPNSPPIHLTFPATGTLFKLVKPFRARVHITAYRDESRQQFLARHGLSDDANHRVELPVGTVLCLRYWKSQIEFAITYKNNKGHSDMGGMNVMVDSVEHAEGLEVEIL